jgi:methionyl-tRNA formyltransferase
MTRSGGGNARQDARFPHQNGRLAVAVLTSSGPHHRYLVATLRAAGLDVRLVVVEPWAAQRARRWKLGKRKDWAWIVYHDLRRKLLGLDAYRRGAFATLPTPLGPEPRTLTVDWINDQAVVDSLRQAAPDVTVVMGTGIIKDRVLEAAGGIVINIHGGYLPDYRGNHCMFFALHNGDFDHIGTTLHFVDRGIDTGDILEVVVPALRPADNAEAMYCRAETAAVHRLAAWLDHYEKGGTLPRTPQGRKGTLYNTRDRKPQHDLSVWWRRRTGRLAVPEREARAPQPMPATREDIAH